MQFHVKNGSINLSFRNYFEGVTVYLVTHCLVIRLDFKALMIIQSFVHYVRALTIL